MLDDGGCMDGHRRGGKELLEAVLVVLDPGARYLCMFSLWEGESCTQQHAHVSVCLLDLHRSGQTVAISPTDWTPGLSE
jgi:hypothetical protein